MNWNPALKLYLEVKEEYLKNIDDKDIFEPSFYRTCFEKWVERLFVIEPEKYKSYKEIISKLSCTQYGTLLLLHYNLIQICSSDSLDETWSAYDGLYRECRSVVIDMKKDCLVLTPFKKFFNLNELEETSLDDIQERIQGAKTVEFSNKLDGSMQSARWYDEKIVMSGSNALDPEKSHQLKDGYRMIHQNPAYKKMLQENEDYTFIFEYISLEDIHVVVYSKEQEGLYLIGIRNTKTGEELNYKDVLFFADKYGIPTTQVFSKTLDELLSELDDKKSDEAEGFVVNIDGYRIKVKYNDYVQVHRIISKMASGNDIVRVIADGTYDDLLSKLPEQYREFVQEKANLVFTYATSIQEKAKRYTEEGKNKTDSLKDFMIYVTNEVSEFYRPYCRSLYKGESLQILKRGPVGNEWYRKMREIVKYLEEYEDYTFDEELDDELEME